MRRESRVPGTRLVLSGTAPENEGIFLVQLPAQAGTLADPPNIAVYYSDVDGDTYFLLSDGFTEESQFWFLTESEGALGVVIIGIPEAWFYRIVVIY